MNDLSPRAQRLIVALSQDEARKSSSAYILPEHIILALLHQAESVGYTLLTCLNVNILNYQLFLEQSLIPAKDLPPGIYELPPSRRLSALIDSARYEAEKLGDKYIGTEHLMLAALLEDSSPSIKFCMRFGIEVDKIQQKLKEAQRLFPSSVTTFGEKKLNNSVIDDLFGPINISPEEIKKIFDEEKNIKRNLQNKKSDFKNQKDDNFKNSDFAKNEFENQSFKNSDLDDENFNQNQNQSQFGSQSKDIKRNRRTSLLSEFSRDLTAENRDGNKDPVIGREEEIQRVIQILSRRTKNNPLLIGEPGVGKTAIVEGLSQKIVKGEVPYSLLKKRVLVLDLAALIAGTRYRGDFEERLKKIMNEVKEDKNILLFIDEIHTIIGAGGQAGQMDASNMLKPALSRGEIQLIGATTRKEYRKYLEKDSAFERRFQLVKVEPPTDEQTLEILLGIVKKYEEFHNVKYSSDVIPLIVKLSHRYIPERFLPDKAIDILDEVGATKKIQEEERPSELAELENDIDKLIEEKRLLVENQDFEKAAIVRDKVKDLKHKLEIFTEYWKKNNGSSQKNVSVDDVYRVVSKMTGVPISDLNQSQITRLINMEDELHKTVVGQHEAIKLISSAVRRNQAGISSTKRPIGSFVFLGPTGVGKTMLAKTLAKFLFGTEESLIRIDMSDFMERHNASRLVGAPPGYVGYDEGGVLTEKVRQHPYSVVLFDEIEKAHSSIFNLLLQILEEGELVDGLGHNVSFKNCVIIMTSNAGAREIISQGKIGFSRESFDEENSNSNFAQEEIKSSAISELKKIMSPELINRIDDIVVFGGLSKKEVSKILDIQLKELSDRLLEKNILLTVKPSAKEYLIQNGYDIEMGARPMRRLIQNKIEDPLSILILQKNENLILNESSKNEFSTEEFSNEIVVEKLAEKISVKFKKSKKIVKKDKCKIMVESK